jgi:hypothetical protein
LITITITQNDHDGQSLPSWVTFDSSTLRISGTAPLVDQTTNYTFYIKSKWSDRYTVTVWKAITIKVETHETVVNDDNDENDENVEVTTAGTVASASTQANLAVVVMFTIVSSILSNSSPTAVWSFVNQFQLITLLMQVDSFTPEDFIHYIKGTSSVNLNFDFIPIKDIPYITWPIDKLDIELDDSKLNAYGIHSRSTFVNLFTIMIMFLVVFVTHLLLLLLPKKDS